MRQKRRLKRRSGNAFMTIEQLFQYAVDHKASDIHCVVGRPPTLRIDGELRPMDGGEELRATDVRGLVTSLVSKERFEKFLEEKELDAAYTSRSGDRFRLNFHIERGNMSFVARLIPKAIPTLEDLRSPEMVKKLLTLPHGLILVTGPTGSGKSTSLAAMIDHINTERAETIVTFEDPIEFLFPQRKSIIRQRQLGDDMRSFPEGLKHVLRQDPDIIMVGEMRDLETIALALTVAETGHLVFATLHTYSAGETIDRIIDVFPPHQQTQIRLQLAMTLRAVIVQQLLPKKGGGRVAARELLLNSPAVANLIRENKTVQIKSVLQTSAKDGMFTFAQDLRRLVLEGAIEKADAQQYLIGEKVE